ncbi:MAG: hypothetical protein RLZZ253_1116 [Verrucomicrobiota bacterium]|jgi:DNA repair exonuclease SbcCD ATPase subunit
MRNRNTRIHPLTCCAASALLAVHSLFGADAGSPEAKLKESLRAALIQARTLQSQKEQADAAKQDAEQKNEALTAELDTLKTKAATDAEKAAHEITELKKRGEAQAESIRELQAALQEWKDAQRKTADLAAKTETERVKWAGRATDLQKQTEEQRAKNLEMYRIGSEILERYEGFGLGTAIRSREPFIGTTRVKLQNLVQDYADKLAGQKIK